jgi:hypothetical protein
MTLTPEAEHALKRILSYLEDSEAKHYEECRGKHRASHIYRHVITLRHAIAWDDVLCVQRRH